MKISYLPVLPVLRELYAQPRTLARFRQYIETLTGGTDDIVVPIGQANPMAKEHALRSLDHLDAIEADRIGADAAEFAQQRLGDLPLELEIKASIVLTDDLGGGWTNRYTTEAMVRFPTRSVLKRPFATALVWTSEAPAVEQVRAEVLAAIYRVAYQVRRGVVSTLAEMMEQEGFAAVFAGVQPTLANADLERAAAIINALDRSSAPYPTIFAVMYGDVAAAELGYQPLGLPPRAGFEVALSEARSRDPVAALG